MSLSTFNKLRSILPRSSLTLTLTRPLHSTPPSPTSFNSTISTPPSLPPSSPFSPPLPSSFTTLLTTPSLLTPTTEAELLSTLARLLMRDGKLSRAHSHLSLMLSHLTLLTSSPPLPILLRAIDLVSPSIRLVGRRKGTKVLPTPQPLSEKQRRRQGWLWIVEASEKRVGAEKVFGKRLAIEVLAVLTGQSEARKKVEGRHAQGVTGRANVGR